MTALLAPPLRRVAPSSLWTPLSGYPSDNLRSHECVRLHKYLRRHATAAVTEVLMKRTGTAALRARRTLNVAVVARLPRCGRRGACSYIMGTILDREPTFRDAPRRLD
ncbi:hypothetical protein EVAR_60310_1 [Eumeta japonica]|uniref:Uncharacterized protein n=1 Tax=Eumeta variegata TaxID=151549 RepID=A0A4C1Z9L4_EUMVA|nr:hypothetical protein EVAR_60310_1 [Eumeta japonica]